MNRQPVKSSNIKSIGYQENIKTLEIEFHSGGVYQYTFIPKAIYESFIEAESIGSYFFLNIKDN